MLRFIIYNILFILIFLFIAYYINIKTNNKNISIIEYLNGGMSKLPAFKNIFLGLLFGIIFGFIDNLGLWIGISKFSQHLGGSEQFRAGIGNTYSDFIGAVLGTFIASIAKDLFNYNDDITPLWLNIIGILIGCILGIIFGETFL